MMCFVIFKCLSPHLVPLPMGEEERSLTLFQVCSVVAGDVTKGQPQRGRERELMPLNSQFPFRLFSGSLSQFPALGWECFMNSDWLSPPSLAKRL